jgi:hypothetical protein
MSVTVNAGTGTAETDLAAKLYATATGLTAYAHERTAVVDQFVTGIGGAVLSLMAPTITPNFNQNAIAPAAVTAPLPKFTTTVWQAPGFPNPITAVLELGDLQIQPFDTAPPVLNFGTSPAAFTGAIPTAPGVNLDFVYPTLSVNLPPVPSLLSLNIVPFDGLHLPTFNATDPVLVAVEPSVREYVPGSRYTSALLMGLEKTLLDRITNGGTGLTPEVENAIWDRGREREYRAQADSLATIDQMESLGYMLPPGSYVDARLKVLTETNYQNVGHSREVMIQASTLMLDNVKNALTASVDLERWQLDYANGVEQRAFESTKYVTEAGIQIYNAKVAAYASMVETYKAKIQVYTAAVQAEVSRVDAYRATIAAEEAKAQINTSLVNQYKVQVDAALSNVEIYKAEIAGIQAKATVEQTKVQVFGEQVRGYTAQIGAYTAGVEGYRASITAEATKQEAYKSQVEAFSARVQAVTQIVDARVKGYEALIQAKTAEYTGYQAQIAGESARVDAFVKTATVQSETYKAEVAAVTSYNEVLTKQWIAQVDQNQRTAEIAIGAAKANGELYISARGLALDAAKATAQVAAQLGAAALNAVNFSGSVSSGESVSGSVSSSTSASQSVAQSQSTNYNYDSSV